MASEQAAKGSFPDATQSLRDTLQAAREELTARTKLARGGFGALARYAEDVIQELDEGDRELAQQIFVQLVRPGQGTEDTRRVAARSELGDDRWRLVRYLADRRLVVTGRDEGGEQETAEVVHEALIQRHENTTLLLGV